MKFPAQTAQVLSPHSVGDCESAHNEYWEEKFRKHPWSYMADAKGYVFSAKVGDEEWKHTGILLPRLAGQEHIPVEELMGEIDIVYKPLQGRDAQPRRHLL